LSDNGVGTPFNNTGTLTETPDELTDEMVASPKVTSGVAAWASRNAVAASAVASGWVGWLPVDVDEALWYTFHEA
jgi:hypothetical protein